jgi:ankyrin repeat protein
MLRIPADQPPASAAIEAIQAGDVETLGRLLEDEPELGTARIVRRPGHTLTLLHVACDWPGHFPNGAQSIRTLLAAGADVGARYEGPHNQTPLHWAASSDDVAVLDALLVAGADIDADGAVIAGSTPLADATAFGQWNAARRLVERGARTGLWEAAALSLVDRVAAMITGDPPPPTQKITEAFSGACHAGWRITAEYLLDRGAELNWVGWDGLSPLNAAERHGDADLAAWLRGRGGRSAQERNGT